MFVVTFYSYKGGVGRTLALANVAAELARRRKSVLVVDFDLEAPGASSFQFNGRSKHSPEQGGIVDFVLSWMKNDISPDIRQYVYECEGTDPSQGAIWVMPAGRMDASYGGRLHQIDFSELYEGHDGFLLIEDLKAQWQEVLQVDYVLIDSRTGHTDIGGICTRQLPDLVAFIFWPNSQNLQGLSYIINELNIDEKEARRSIDRIFVPSNLPTLDDEEEVLKRLLAQFQNALEYDRGQEVRLHHYPSLELLEQKIFTVHRPNSRLGREYKRLADAVQRQNPQDEDGVLLFLERILRSMRATGVQISETSESDQRRLEGIYGSSWSNPKINRMLAVLKSGDGDFAQAIQLIEGIISAGNANLIDYFYLASWLMASGSIVDPREAIVEPREIIDRLLDDPEANQKEVLAAIRLISKFELQNEYTELASRRAVVELTSRQLARICGSVQDDELQTRLVGDLIYKFVASADEGGSKFVDSSDRSAFVLCLISAGHFAAAIEVLRGNKGEASDRHKKTASLFNLAVATWGKDGSPSVELFEQVIITHLEGEPNKHERNPNYHQCLALSYATVKNKETALSFLVEAREIMARGTSSFSCWSYLMRGQYAFINELDEMKSWITSGVPLPRFLRHDRTDGREQARLDFN